MPTPVGHSTAGLLLYILKNRVWHWRTLFKNWRAVLFFVFLANLPDIDLINPHTGKLELEGEFHHQEVHSLGFVLLAALLVAGIGRVARKKWDWRLGFWSFLAVASHVLLDYFFSNSNPGMPVLFPFWSKKFTSPIGMAYELDEMNLFGLENWFHLLREGSISLIVLTVGLCYSFLRNRSKR